MLIINNRFLSLYDYNFLLVIEKIFLNLFSKICGSLIYYQKMESIQILSPYLYRGLIPSKKEKRKLLSVRRFLDFQKTFSSDSKTKSEDEERLQDDTLSRICPLVSHCCLVSSREVANRGMVSRELSQVYSPMLWCDSSLAT